MADSICPSTAAPGDQPDGAAVARVEKALHRRGAFTEIMGKVLDFCRQRRLLAEVEEIADDLYFGSGGVGSPSVLIRGLAIAGS